jgi:hypothetical protein
LYDPDDHEELLNRVRVGTIVGPDYAAHEGLSPDDPPALDGHAIALPAPAWLIRAFTPDQVPLHHRFAVYPTSDGRERVALVTMQHATTQLTFVLPMSDAGVKTFLADCIKRKALQFMLMHEEDRACFSVIRVDAPFREAQQLHALMRDARPNSQGIRTLAEMTLDVAAKRAVTSLVQGELITDVMAVLSGSEIAQAMTAAFGGDSEAAKQSRKGLH